MQYSAPIAAQGAQTHGHAGGLHIVRRFWQAPRIEFLRGFDNGMYQTMQCK